MKPNTTIEYTSKVLEQALKDKTIVAMYRYIGGREDYFGFQCAEGEGNYAFLVTSDCCSQSWLEGIDILCRFPARVLEVSERVGETHCRFIKIKTTKGYIDLDGRNDGGSSEQYSFTYEERATNTHHQKELDLASVTSDWASFGKLVFHFAPGFKDGAGFQSTGWVVLR